MAHIVKIQDGYSFYVREGETLLEVLEAQNIQTEYQCRQGYCGSCQLQLVEGQVEYNREPPLAFIPDGRVLPCCCEPRSDLVLALAVPVPPRSDGGAQRRTLDEKSRAQQDTLHSTPAEMAETTR